MAAIVDPALWDPVPVTLPTYVTKPAAARRTVRTIDLDDTGVWTSGRTDADSQIAREADEADKAARKARGDGDEQPRRRLLTSPVGRFGVAEILVLTFPTASQDALGLWRSW